MLRHVVSYGVSPVFQLKSGDETGLAGLILPDDSDSGEPCSGVDLDTDRLDDVIFRRPVLQPDGEGKTLVDDRLN